MSEPELNESEKHGERQPVPAIETAVTGMVQQPDLPLKEARLTKPFQRIPVIVLVCCLASSLYVSGKVKPQWSSSKSTYNVFQNEEGQLIYVIKGSQIEVEDVVAYEDSPLRPEVLLNSTDKPSLLQQWVVEDIQKPNGMVKQYSLLKANFHFGIWSLLPAFLAIAMCLLTKEPLTALFSAIVVGAFMLGRFDITDAVLLPSLASNSAATILLLYLWLLGGLTGIWSKTGAAESFGRFMTKHFVKGPNSARLVAWFLGVIFFQGGTVSVVLVGTIVKPVADKERISHEELSYIVDSTASPIASVLAFNAWPLYIQALIFVPGVAFLATEADRLSFFFRSIPFSFYGILAVLSTFLLSLGITRFAGKGIREAIKRSRTTGQLDAPGAMPMSAEELHITKVPSDYEPDAIEFFIPMALLIGTAIGTFIFLGSPRVNWAFGIAFLISVAFALLKGMKLGDVVEGIGDGLKGVVFASVILVLAVTVGSISGEVGAGLYLVDLLGNQIPPIALPITLQLLTMVIAFSTGTSWGTYAIAFPLAMPLAWEVGMSNNITNPELFMSLCFATVLNGSVFGDQCSPLSDTTILSAMTTGCDLMDHVRTQLIPASLAAGAAAILWTGSVLFCL